MNRPAVIWAVTGTVIGTVVGYVVGRTALEAQVRKEYADSSAALKSAYEMASSIKTESPVLAEIDLFNDIVRDVDTTGGEIVATGEIETYTAVDGTIMTTELQEEPVQNDYHKAISANETSVEMFVDGGVNDYGMSYIEEEEYIEEDGRFKGKIDILMDEHNPVFMMDGQQIHDWDRRIGDSILVDFYKLVPPGVDPVLYVRNHRTDEDYEVVRVVP